MRELTQDELALISGGYGWDNEDVVVTGTPYTPPSFPYFPPSGPSFPYTPPSYPSTPPSSGSPPPPPQTPHPRDDCAADATADKMATHADSQYLEYRGFVYRGADGQIYSSDVASSNQQGGVSVTPAQVGVPANYTPLATVHNHPTHILQDPATGYSIPITDPEVIALQRLPSNTDMAGLKSYAEALRDQGRTDWQDYSIYIVFGNDVTQYKYGEQDWSKQRTPDQDRNAATWAAQSAYDPCV